MASPRVPKPKATAPQPRPAKTPAPAAPDNLLAGIRVWALVGTVGWQAAVPIVVLGGGGAWLDKRWGTTPALMLVGCALALAVSSVLVWRTIQIAQRQLEATIDPANNPASGPTNSTDRRR